MTRLTASMACYRSLSYTKMDMTFKKLKHQKKRTMRQRPSWNKGIYFFVLVKKPIKQYLEKVFKFDKDFLFCWENLLTIILEDCIFFYVINSNFS